MSTLNQLRNEAAISFRSFGLRLSAIENGLIVPVKPNQWERALTDDPYRVLSASDIIGEMTDQMADSWYEAEDCELCGRPRAICSYHCKECGASSDEGCDCAAKREKAAYANAVYEDDFGYNESKSERLTDEDLTF